MGDYAAARRYYEQALAIRKEVLGEKHPCVATSLHNLGWVFGKLGQWSETSRLMDEACRVARRHIALILPNLLETEQHM